jgi:hypothetical protein
VRRKAWQREREREHILHPEVACRSLSGLPEISVLVDLSYMYGT